MLGVRGRVHHRRRRSGRRSRALADAPPVIDAVQALVDKSLLRRWVPPLGPPHRELDEPSFGMYLSIHEYATEKRHQRGAEAEHALQQRHGRCFAAFGTDAAIEALATHGGMQRQHALRNESTTWSPPAGAP